MIASVRHCWSQPLRCRVIYEPSDSGSIFSDIINRITSIELFALLSLFAYRRDRWRNTKKNFSRDTAARSANVRFVVFHEVISVKIHFSCFLNRVQMYISRCIERIGEMKTARGTNKVICVFAN